MEIATDITDRKQAEEIRERLVKELESRNAEMERFTYTVSHDLRSPLITVNGLVGFLKSDLEKGNTTRIDTYFKRISNAIAKMDNLLKDTLELSRIGRVANPPENVPFGETKNGMRAVDSCGRRRLANDFRDFHTVAVLNDHHFAARNQLAVDA